MVLSEDQLDSGAVVPFEYRLELVFFRLQINPILCSRDPIHETRSFSSLLIFVQFWVVSKTDNLHNLFILLLK